jgi:thiosulfate dehydrogenase [quinone] large subunit
MNQSATPTADLPLKTDPFAATCAMFMLRIWLGLRCLQAGIEKYAGTVYISKPTIVNGVPDPNGTETVIELKQYALENYSGIPSSLADQFKNEPFISEFFLGLYNQWLGPVLIVVGLCVLIGLATRVSLLAMGLIYTSLTYGLILLNQASGIAWLGTHIILIALALLLASYNRLELGNLLAHRTGLNWLRDK